jgi:hypothetical protein
VRRRPFHQNPPLHRAFVRDRYVSADEITQPAVHQLRAPPARAGRQVSTFQQCHRQAAAGGVQCNPDAGDPAADNEQVDDITGGQPLELAGSARGRE